MRRWIVGLVLTMALNTPVRADFNDGVYAFQRGQYETALQTFVPLAETQDHPYAQHFLGMMYYKGQGVPQDYKEAAKWFLKAAQQGVSQSQYKLGTMYAEGYGVDQDYESAYAWFSVAAKLGHKQAPEGLASAQEKLKPDELAAAKRLAVDFEEKYGKPPEAMVKSE